MYAKCFPKFVYHLPGEDGQHSLCGLTGALIVTDRPARTVRAPSDEESTSRRRIVCGLRQD